MLWWPNHRQATIIDHASDQVRDACVHNCLGLTFVWGKVVQAGRADKLASQQLSVMLSIDVCCVFDAKVC